MAPIIECSELVKRDVADESMALVVVGRGNIARHAVVAWLDARGNLPSAACVEGIRRVRVVLIHSDYLLRVIGIDGDTWLGEVSGLGSQGDNAGVWGLWRELCRGIPCNCREHGN